MNKPMPQSPPDQGAGVKQLIARLDEALELEEPEQIVAAIRTALCDCMRNATVRLPQACYEVCTSHYARRLLHRSPRYGYSVVAMTWGPEQRTPIHDHCGMWCVEGIWDGEIEVVQYELLEAQGERYRFESRGCMQACVGSAGSLIPPHEYHTIANPSRTETAVSVHVYSGEMKYCNAFVPVGEGWYRREARQLAFD